MRAKRKRQRRVNALIIHSFVYEPVDNLRPRNLGTNRKSVSKKTENPVAEMPLHEQVKVIIESLILC